MEYNPITTYLMITSKYAHHLKEYEQYVKFAEVSEEVSELIKRSKKHKQLA